MSEIKLNLSSGFGLGLVLGLSVVGLSAVLPCFSRVTNKYNQKKSINSSESEVVKSSVYKTTPVSVTEIDEVASDREAFWFTENMSPFLGVRMALNRILFEGKSTFQRVQVIETKQFGKTLVMDGQTQSAEFDEKIYHESLVHPAMLLHPDPKTVFIGGGGEFATAREVLRHTTVEKCVMVDIDKLACDICREQLPEWNDSAYEDDRFLVVYDDAKQWLEDNDLKFDIIILDICDPIEAGPGYKLYTKEFYTFLEQRLTNNGILVTQSGPGSVYNVKNECFTVIHNTLSNSFRTVTPYTVDIPSFGCNWGFNIASNSTLDNFLEIDGTTIEKKLENRLKKNTNLYFLDGVSIKGIFGVAKSIRKQCAEEGRVMTIDNPVFMYSS